MAEAMSITFDAAKAGAALDEIADQVEALVRPAAQAGAQVFYDEVKTRVGSIGRITGNLDESIYQVFSADNSGPGKATYHISWNAKKAPHGHLVEYGHIQSFKAYVGSDGKWYTSKTPLPNGPKRVAARPFLRPSFDTRRVSALEATKVRFETDMQAVLNRVSA